MFGSMAQHIVALGGRVLLSLIFLASAVGHVLDWSGSTSYMTSYGMPMVHVFLAGAVAFLFVGGLSVLLGLRARWGAVMLIVFLIPTTLIFHAFWTIDPAEAVERKMQMIQFLKNLGLIGGLLMVLAHGSGSLGLDMFFRDKLVNLFRRKPKAA
jgi:putative oxidoreductase